MLPPRAHLGQTAACGCAKLQTLHLGLAVTDIKGHGHGEVLKRRIHGLQISAVELKGQGRAV